MCGERRRAAPALGVKAAHQSRVGCAGLASARPERCPCQQSPTGCHPCSLLESFWDPCGFLPLPTQCGSEARFHAARSWDFPNGEETSVALRLFSWGEKKKTYFLNSLKSTAWSEHVKCSPMHLSLLLIRLWCLMLCYNPFKMEERFWNKERYQCEMCRMFCEGGFWTPDAFQQQNPGGCLAVDFSMYVSSNPEQGCTVWCFVITQRVPGLH